MSASLAGRRFFEVESEHRLHQRKRARHAAISPGVTPLRLAHNPDNHRCVYDEPTLAPEVPETATASDSIR